MKDLIKHLIKFFNRTANYLFWKVSSRKNKLPKIKTILIINDGFIGDLISITPLLDVLKKNKIKVGLAIRQEMEPLFKIDPRISNLISFQDLFRSNLKKYDALLLISPNNPKFIQSLKDKNNLILAQPFHNHFSTLSKQLEGLTPPFIFENHRVIQNLNYLKLIPEINFNLKNISPANHPLTLYFNRQEIKLTLNKYKIQDDFIIISPGSRGQKKLGVKFPEPIVFANVIKYLVKLKFKVVLIGSKQDESFCKDSCLATNNKKRVLNLAGKTSINELIGLISASSGIVAIDSGSVHIASCLNKKTIDLIRKSATPIWYPWTTQKFILIKSKNENLNKVSSKEIITAINEINFKTKEHENIRIN